MLAQYLDISDVLDSGESALIELSNYDYCVLQIAGGTGATYDYVATIDSGAITGTSDGNISSAQNFLPVGAINLSTQAYETTNGGGDGLWQFGVVGRYLKIKFNAGTPSGIKAIVMLAKIS
jgi:hypothetical protein